MTHPLIQWASWPAFTLLALLLNQPWGIIAIGGALSVIQIGANLHRVLKAR